MSAEPPKPPKSYPGDSHHAHGLGLGPVFASPDGKHHYTGTNVATTADAVTIESLRKAMASLPVIESPHVEPGQVFIMNPQDKLKIFGGSPVFVSSNEGHNNSGGLRNVSVKARTWAEAAPKPPPPPNNVGAISGQSVGEWWAEKYRGIQKKQARRKKLRRWLTRPFLKLSCIFCFEPWSCRKHPWPWEE